SQPLLVTSAFVLETGRFPKMGLYYTGIDSSTTGKNMHIGYTEIILDDQLYTFGDLNGDGYGPDISDLTFLINFLFLSGSPPIPLETADMNNDGDVDISDLTAIVNYLFLGGNQPESDCW
ncbi:MAG: dockerin type I domain-containing protein, partial [candidate division Zixibacteria bacterium]